MNFTSAIPSVEFATRWLETTQQPMLVSEAEILYAYHAEESFLISMIDRQSREDVDRGKFHDLEAHFYAQLLLATEVTLPDTRSDWWRNLRRYASTWQYDLHLERKALDQKELEKIHDEALS